MKPSCSKIKFNNLISPLEIAEKHRLTLSPKLDKIKQSTFGQYFTPSIASKYMASLFDFNNKSSLKLLEPGAGVGSLAAAVVEILCQEKRPPQNIEFTLVENDSSLIDNLYEVMNLCVEKCKQSNINFEFEIINDDFIKYALNIINSNSQQLCLFNNDINTIKFDLVIMNPPYKKINNFSEAKKNLNNHNIEVTNLYSAFLWLANDLLNTNGELVAITPRSFCNGPYFKAFRENIFSKSSLTEIHLFNSRNSIFNYDKVLQENIIFKLIKCIKRDFVKVKFSDDITGTEKIKSKFFDYKSIINYNDPNLFIHIPSSDQFNEIVDTMTQLKYFLSDIGIEASTGKIVDFRNKEYLKENSQINTVPLLYPFNFKNGNIEWPIINSRKPNYIEYQDRIKNLFLISDFYVLCKRFSSKEEKKRIVAVLYNPEKNNFKKIGFENHINYFHANGKGLTKHLAIGLVLYLNSTLVDQYFRTFNGHTQVNATDLRNLKYPSKDKLEYLGLKYKKTEYTQEEIDCIILKELF